MYKSWMWSSINDNKVNTHVNIPWPGIRTFLIHQLPCVSSSHSLFSSFCFPAPSPPMWKKGQRGIPALWPPEVSLHLSFLSPPFLAFLALCYLVTQDQEEEVRGYIERLHRGWSAGQKPPATWRDPYGSLAKTALPRRRSRDTLGVRIYRTYWEKNFFVKFSIFYWN